MKIETGVNLGTLVYNITEVIVFLVMAYFLFFKPEVIMTKIFKKFDRKTKNISYVAGIIVMIMAITAMYAVLRYFGLEEKIWKVIN